MPLHSPYFRQVCGLMLPIILLACRTEQPPGAPVMVSTEVRAVSTPPPDYPAQLGCMGVGGTTLLKVIIDVNGKPSQTVLLSSSGEPLLDQAAIAGIQPWQFRAATRNGQAIPATIHVPVRFNPPPLKPDWCFAIDLPSNSS